MIKIFLTILLSFFVFQVQAKSNKDRKPNQADKLEGRYSAAIKIKKAEREQAIEKTLEKIRTLGRFQSIESKGKSILSSEKGSINAAYFLSSYLLLNDGSVCTESTYPKEESTQGRYFIQCYSESTGEQTINLNLELDI